MINDKIRLLFNNTILFLIANGALPVLPIYARELGMSDSLIGAYLAISFLALASGTLVTGWLTLRFNIKRLLVGISTLTIPCTILTGLATSPAMLIASTSLMFLLGGIQNTLISLCIGHQASDASRGRAFGVLFATASVGVVVGGLTFGPIAELHGFISMFALIAALQLLGLMLLVNISQVKKLHKSITKKSKRNISLPFILLLLIAFNNGFIIVFGRLGYSLSMDNLGFSKSLISIISAIGGLFILPLLPIIGKFSDQFGRKKLLFTIYLTGILGFVGLAFAKDFIGFAIAISLLSVFGLVGRAVATAFAFELTSHNSPDMGVSLFTSVFWIGSILGFMSAGISFENFDEMSIYIFGAIMSAISIIILFLMKSKSTLSQVRLKSN